MSYKGDFIDGQFVKVEKPDGEFKDISPADLNDLLMRVPFRHENVDVACQSARAAFKEWSHLKPDQRKEYL
jgi:succinylglutamic semialdehyde dehydrogenase